MLIEERVFGGQAGVDQVLRNLVERYDCSLAAVGVVELPQQRAFAIEDLRRLEARVIADLAERRQVPGEHRVARRGAL